MNDFDKKFDFDSNTFEDMKHDMNFVLQRLLGNMIEKQSDEGKAGKNMPVDPTMISYRRPGAGVKAKEKIVTPECEVVCADKVSSESAEGFGYISHFATCKARNH